MKKRTLPSIDFPAQITRLKQALSSRGVSVDEVSYSPEAYGSWSLTAGSKEKKLSFSYDAQLSELRYHDTKIAAIAMRTDRHSSYAIAVMPQNGINRQRWHNVRKPESAGLPMWQRVAKDGN